MPRLSASALPLLIGAAVLAASVAAAAPARAAAIDLFYERTVMSAADARCNLFTPTLGSALNAARAQARRGAEVFVHSPSEIGSPLATPKAVARRARAFENIAYVVSANTAGISGMAMALPARTSPARIGRWNR